MRQTRRYRDQLVTDKSKTKLKKPQAATTSKRTALFAQDVPLRSRSATLKNAYLLLLRSQSAILKNAYFLRLNSRSAGVPPAPIRILSIHKPVIPALSCARQ